MIISYTTLFMARLKSWVYVGGASLSSGGCGRFLTPYLSMKVPRLSDIGFEYTYSTGSQMAPRTKLRRFFLLKTIRNSKDQPLHRNQGDATFRLSLRSNARVGLGVETSTSVIVTFLSKPISCASHVLRKGASSTESINYKSVQDYYTDRSQLCLRLASRGLLLCFSGSPLHHLPRLRSSFGKIVLQLLDILLQARYCPPNVFVSNGVGEAIPVRYDCNI